MPQKKPVEIPTSSDSQLDIYKSIFSKSGHSYLANEHEENTDVNDISVDPPTSSTGGFS